MTQQNDQLLEIERRLQELELKQQRDIREHRHDGNLATRVNTTDLIGLFEVVSSVPTLVPRNAYEQIKIYTNGTTYRLYWYDQINHSWRYATGT